MNTNACEYRDSPDHLPKKVLQRHLRLHFKLKLLISLLLELGDALFEVGGLTFVTLGALAGRAIILKLHGRLLVAREVVL